MKNISSLTGILAITVLALFNTAYPMDVNKNTDASVTASACAVKTTQSAEAKTCAAKGGAIKAAAVETKGATCSASKAASTTAATSCNGHAKTTAVQTADAEN